VWHAQMSDDIRVWRIRVYRFMIIKAFRNGGCTGMYEKAGKGIDERLKESTAALDKATTHVQSVFEHIKNRAK